MDNQQVSPQSVVSPQPSQGQNSSKNSTTPWIILLLLVAASTLTGLAYFFLPSLLTNEKTPVATDIQPTPPPSESPQTIAKWQAYTNTKYHYSFFYPETWEIQDKNSDEKNIVLQYRNDTNPGTTAIQIDYLTPQERTNNESLSCEGSNEANCRSSQLTTNSRILIDYAKHEALISLPEGGGLLIQFLESEPGNETAFATLLATITFPNEERLNKLRICPDTWPTTAETVSYNGVEIPTKDIDATFVQTDCTKQ